MSEYKWTAERIMFLREPSFLFLWILQSLLHATVNRWNLLIQTGLTLKEIILCLCIWGGGKKQGSSQIEKPHLASHHGISPTGNHSKTLHFIVCFHLLHGKQRRAVLKHSVGLLAQNSVLISFYCIIWCSWMIYWQKETF